MYYRWYLFLCIVAFGLSGCGNEVIYKESRPIEGDTWEYDEMLCFPFEIQDTSQLFGINLAVRHQTHFPFQNQYVKIHTSFPDGHIKENIVSLELAGNTGWKGNCSGNNCIVNIPLQAETYFNTMGEYQICFEQYSRKDSVEGLKSFEIKISKLIL